MCLSLFVFIMGCAATPAPVPAPLQDRTADTDYRLGEVSDKLRQADDFRLRGNRAAAVGIIGTAQRMLPEGHGREQDYLEVIKAGVWARQGEGHDAERSSELLEPVREAARRRGDSRMLSDINLVEVMLKLAAGDKLGAARAGDSALQHLRAVEAWTRKARNASELAMQFMEHDDLAAARSFARRALQTASRLEDDESLIRANITLAQVELIAGDDFEARLLDAYEAAYRMGSVGWRNVVIAQAVDAWFSLADMQAVQRWGNRLREQETGSLGNLPDREHARLWHDDYITVMAQYAFAIEEIGSNDAMAREAAELALRAISELPEAERAWWQELEENLRDGPLKDSTGK